MPDDMKRLSQFDSAPAEPARLGAELRDARVALGLSIEDLAQSLRIRRVYLAALEEGRVRDLPAPAYAVGFVRTYARSLGLDEADVVRRFREASGPTVARKTDLVFPEPVPDRGVPAGAVMLVGAVLALGAYIGWYQWSGSGSRTVDAVPPPPPAIEQALREGSPPETVPELPAAAPSPSNANAAPVPVLPGKPPAGAAVPAPPPAAPAAPTAPEGRILLRARAEVWIQVRERQGGPVLVNRVLRPGESWQVPARDGLLLSTGNAGGLEVLVDGLPTPGLGAGQMVRRDLQVDAEKLKAGQPLSPLAPPLRPAPGSAPASAPPQ
ncbi:helix-turn-helix domain-containing protein [Dankookia rubra]|uniref:helix-turn-helix domain-containing protein n=1 Tax=Dankookia rubra TaxID=1442381 RepID=UPI00140AE894|nr:helix-turn-helix domain-containing protein [Dankookia rubra]